VTRHQPGESLRLTEASRRSYSQENDSRNRFDREPELTCHIPIKGDDHHVIDITPSHDDYCRHCGRQPRTRRVRCKHRARSPNPWLPASAGLCLLGRLALGSVVAADSLHDCFGEASHRWAEGVVDRLGLLRAGH